MSKENRFTSLVLRKDQLLTGDKQGNFLSWEFSRNNDEIYHTIIGTVNEEISDVAVSDSGLEKICRTKSCRFYYWALRLRAFGGDPEIIDGDMINRISCPSSDDEGNYTYDLAFRAVSYPFVMSKAAEPYLIKHRKGEGFNYEIEHIDILSGDVIHSISMPKCYETFRAWQILFKDDFFITFDGVWVKETEECISEIICTYGDGYCHDNMEKYEKEGYALSSYVVDLIQVGTCDSEKSMFAFIEEIGCDKLIDYDELERISNLDEYEVEPDHEISNFYFVRICGIELDEAKEEYELFGWTEASGLETEYEFRIKKDEATKFSFYEDIMATITDKGNIKIFDVKNKRLIHEIFPLKMKDTNEFGELL